MKLSSKGIGWLVAGALICATAFPGNGIGDTVSTIMIGLVFIVIYFMKQRFQPRGLGWFIAGGILIAFFMDCLFDMAGGIFSQSGSGSTELSDLLFTAIFAGFFMFMFYRSNKAELDDIADDADIGESEFPYQEEVFREDTVTVETEQVVTPAEGKVEVEFEVSDDKQ